MTLFDAYKIHSGALDLDRFLKRYARRLLRHTLVVLVLLLSAYFLAASVIGLPFIAKAAGAALVFGSLLLTLWLVESYYNTYYYYGFNSVIGLDDRKVTGVTFEVASIIAHEPDDLTTAFLRSPLGREAMLRLGLKPEVIETFFTLTRSRIPATAVTIDNELIIRLERLGILLLQRDATFKEFLRTHAVFEEQFLGALTWIGNRFRLQKRTERWWSKDSLSKTTSFGQEWAYGQTYYLQTFAKDIRTSAVFSTLSAHSAYAKEKIEEIESVLARDVSANVLLVGEAGVGKIDLLMEIARRMAVGEALQAIANQHMVVLDTAKLFMAFESKQEIETAITELFVEAQSAGNVILVIENISSFIEEARSIDIPVTELIDSFLASEELHVIATETPGKYHTHLEPLRGFTRRFQEVLVDTPSVESTVRVLAGIADQHELARETLFTYQALTAVAIAAERYIVNGVMPDKAVQLMADVYAQAESKGINLITADDVYVVVTEKTGIPTGPILNNEKETLLNLERILHQKIIGQDKAIQAIAKTMRRARAGIQDGGRPIGSFLFLGPTGVGKTETAKALASVFFQSEAAMSRLDMSEYSDEGAVARLIGTVETAGELSNLLQERPYCVLLLDEFEKADKHVHDLFLQILDEGMFTDGRGSKVNARNTIVIATSNAGSALIINTITHRKTMAVLDAEIIAHIINTGIFKPELINRFDSTILFEPLLEHEQSSVAQLMLKDLADRIHAQGYTLEVTESLIQALVKRGYSPEFGARPMRRLLQDLVEEKVAQKIISGNLVKGGTVLLDVADFTALELAPQRT